jgi:hypothetical protein
MSKIKLFITYLINIKVKIKNIKNQNLLNDFSFSQSIIFPNFIKLRLLPIKIKIYYIFFAFTPYLMIKQSINE